jgi:hypothetical protein
MEPPSSRGTPADWFYGGFYLLLLGHWFTAVLLAVARSTFLGFLSLTIWLPGVYVLGKGIEAIRHDFDPHDPRNYHPPSYLRDNEPPEE